MLWPTRNRLVQRVINDLRGDLYDALQRQAFRYHDRSSTGELVSRSTTDMSRLMDFLFACLFMSVDIAVALVATPAQPVFVQVGPTVTVMVLRSPLSVIGDEAKSAETLLVEM
jgi:ABC-type multidrug transport system fused ATPase/permease subunit